MDRLVKLAAVAAAAAMLVVAPACGKKDKDKNKNQPAPSVKTPPTPPKEEQPPAPKMTSADLAKKYQDCWGFIGAKDWDKFGGCYANDAKSTWLDSGMPDMMGRGAIIDNAKAYIAAFPDWKGTPQLILVNGSNVASVAHVAGTHEGVLKSPKGEIPATKKKMGLLVAHGVMFNDKGEATQEWFVQDFGTLMAQLGLSPMPGRPVMDKGWTETAEVVIAADSQTEKDNLAAHGKAIETWNGHDPKALEALLADDVTQWIAALPQDGKGKAAFVGTAKMYWTAFPDAKITVDSSWAAGDYVVAVGSGSGTNKGPMPPAVKKPTGKSATVKMVQFTKIAGGKVAGEWVFYNGAAMAEQLGLVPPPAK